MRKSEIEGRTDDMLRWDLSMSIRKNMQEMNIKSLYKQVKAHTPGQEVIMHGIHSWR
jgi:hypothetical protein